jgi:uncharacterized membrane protein YkvA (DUF1232 family)
MKSELMPVIRRMPAYVKLAWAVYREPGVGTGGRAVLGAGILYAVSPVDLVPGFIPVAGQLDDIIFALGSLRWVMGGMPPEILDQYRDKFGIGIEDLDRDLAAAKRIAAGLIGRTFKYSARGAFIAGRAGISILGKLAKRVFSK